MKRLLVVLLFVGIFLNFSATSLFAQIQPSGANSTYYEQSRVSSDVNQDSSSRTQIMLIEIMSALTCQIAGVDPVNPNTKCLGVDTQTGKIGYVENGRGAIGVASNLIGMTFNIPISSSQYINYVASNFGISKNTYAQANEGAGFSSLWMLMPAWIQFRNVVYVIFVIIFMLIGLGIVFRFKVDPRTVMTIQNSIPKAIIVLVLITFSFAITGFMIDMMYILMYLLYELVNGIDGVQVGGLSPTHLIGSTPFGAMDSLGGLSGLTWHSASSIGDIIESIMRGIFDRMFDGGGIFSRAAGWVAGNTVGNIFNGLATVITALIIFVAICFALFRLWFALLKAYVFILIDTVIAPIWIAGSLIPGSPLTAGSWFRHLLKYLLVFPLTLAMFLLGAVFVEIFTTATTTSQGSPIFTPPFIGSPINPQHFGALIGLAIILMTPEVINMMQSVLNAPENKFQQSIGRSFGVGAGVVNAPVSRARESLFKRDADGTPIGPGAIAQKYLLRGARSKVSAGASRVTAPIKRAASPVGSVVPQSVRDKIRPVGWLREKMLQEDYNAQSRGRLSPEGFERIQKAEAQADQQVVKNNNQLLNKSGDTINIEITPEYTDEEKSTLTNEQIAPVAQSIHTRKVLNGQHSDEAENWKEAQQQILHGQLEQIRTVQEKINNKQDLTDVDREVFKGLAGNIVNDVRFQDIMVRERNNPANTSKNKDEVRQIALKQYNKMFPILSKRYALQEAANERA